MFAVGQSIGSYRIVRKLGQGGMGAVFEVVHEELARRAAIKVLHPEYAKEEHSIQRFFNEARAVNIIRHPGLVGIFESGRLDDGCAFIVMEFLDGQLLGQRLESVQHLPLREVLHLGRQIAAALDVAHQKGIVHRVLELPSRTWAEAVRWCAKRLSGLGLRADRFLSAASRLCLGAQTPRSIRAAQILSTDFLDPESLGHASEAAHTLPTPCPAR